MDASTWRDSAAAFAMVLGVGGIVTNVWGTMVLRARDRQDFERLRDQFDSHVRECSDCPGRQIGPHLVGQVDTLSEQVGDLRVEVAAIRRNGGGHP